MQLYFEAGALEVWLWTDLGAMQFFGPDGMELRNGSEICSRFPPQINLR